MEIIINEKPLSVNKVWQGKRFKTKEYKAYEELLLYILPKGKVPAGKLRIDYVFGFSNSASDIDNPVKPITDILSKKYGFNDKMIYESRQKKVIVKKGQEYIKVRIKSYQQDSL